MKKRLHILSALAASALALGACSDNDFMELDKGSDILTISSSQDVVTLSEGDWSSEALTLSWTTGNNYGTGNKIYYTLDVAPAGTSFASYRTLVESMAQTYSFSMTVQELNEFLTDFFGGSGTYDLEARVTATVDGQSETQVSTTAFTVTTYTPATTTLYIIGDATLTGWSADSAESLTWVSPGIFTWEGYLKEGDFKFITTRGSFLPSYNIDESGSLYYRSSDDEPDGKYTVTEAHYYKITVNLNTGELTIVQTEGNTPAYDQIWIVGGFSGWSFIEMTNDALDPYLFRYGGYFSSESEFKFGTAKGWDNMYQATSHNASYTDQSVSFAPSEDYKWRLTSDEAGKYYKVCLDIRSGKERMMMKEFTPYGEMYLVGDATPSGWDISNATAMTQSSDDECVFTWTGSLSTGELKFTCDRKSDWMGAWFLASSSSATPTGQTEQMLFIDKSDSWCKSQYLDVNVGDVDMKWKISEAGTYTITLNQLTEEVTIAKQ